MADLVKFSMHLRLYIGMLQQNHLGVRLTDPQMINHLGVRLTDPQISKILGPGPHEPQDWCPWYSTPNVAMEHIHVIQDSRFSATIYQWLSAVSGIVFQSLAVAETPFEAPLWTFAWQNLDRTFFNDISKESAYSKFWPHVIRGPLSSRGPYARAYRA